LLQKREENALTLASTANNARIFDRAYAPAIPISPNKRTILMVAILLGLAIPVVFMYIRDLFRFKIEDRKDVEKITSLPIVGDIPRLKSMPQGNSIVVLENSNDIMAESFRDMRTNIMYMLGKDEKVVLVTSTSSGEGKSFVSTNLAISMALMGKKVIVVGLDIRKPGLNKSVGMTSKAKGISNFLANPEMDLMSLIYQSETFSNLSYLFGGAIPPNPTELLTRDSLPQAIEILKQHFDYIVLDTAPIGMVTDTQIISRLADVSVYVCRADYTHKSDYKLINELSSKKRILNLCTVINSIDYTKKKYGYGYGGYSYGYGKKYGYGYGQDKKA
ncbi:MAG: polysaccharide biosynthesis tyrosine autokinase, partial [Rikenellaceae bacterium]